MRAPDVRLVWHDKDQNTNITMPFHDENQTVEYLSNLLDKLVDDGHATGGGIEEWVTGVGWTMEQAMVANADV